MISLLINIQLKIMRQNAMKISLDKIILDYHFSEILGTMCIRNGLITNFNEEQYRTESLQWIKEDKSPLIGMKKLLILVTLFEKIDFSSLFDISRLADIGLVDEEIMKCNSENNKLIIEKTDNVYLETLSLFNIYKSCIVKILKKRHGILLSNQKITKIINEGLASSFSESFIEDNKNMQEKLTYKIIEGMFYETCTSLIKTTISKNTTYYSNLFESSNLEVNLPKINIEKIYYIAQVQLPNEVNLLPMPQTLNEALQMRKSPYLCSFRRVFTEWSNYLSRGELSLAKKMEKDLIKANQNLCRLEKYRKFTQSPYFRVANLIGGEIPILSTILNITLFTTSFLEEGIQRNNEWILMPSRLS